jgi:hypothetical protein
MSISFDKCTQADLNGTGANSYTPGTGSNGLIVVVVDGELSTDTVTGVTVNGNAMTLAGKSQIGTGVDFGYFFYYFAGSLTGTALTIQVSASTGTPHYTVASYFGMQQSGAVDGSAVFTSNSSSSISNSLTTVADNCWVISSAHNIVDEVRTITAGTARSNLNANFVAIIDTNAAVSPPASTTLGFTTNVSTNQHLGQIFVSFKPFGAAAPVVHSLSSLGAGA